ncbi:MAG: MFS transporter [bacterium]|nr:MFS transporter [bacterium]
MNLLKLLNIRKFTNIHKIALITFFSSLYLYGHVGTLYLQARSLSLFQVSSIWSIIVATIFLAEVPTGVIADKIGRKKSIIIALLLQLIGEVWYIFADTYLVFVVIAIIAGVGFSFASGCIEALIYDTLPKDKREDEMKKAMGAKGAAYYLAFFAAPLLGSLLVPVFTLERFLTTVFLTACSVFIALLLAFTLKEPKKEYEHEEESPIIILKHGIQHIRGNNFLLWLTAISVFTATFSGTLGSLFQPYFVHFNLTAMNMGIASAIGALLAVGLQKNIFMIEQWLGKRTTLIASTILPGIGFLFMAAAPTPIIAFVAFLFTYGTAEIKNPLISSYQNGVIPEKIRATVLSLINLFVSLYGAVVGLTMGWFANQHTTYPFILAGILIIFFATIFRVDKIATKQSQAMSS